jgi:signal transduction histidine kinase
VRLFGSLRFRLVASFLAIVIVTLASAGITLYARMDSYRDDLAAGTLRLVAPPFYNNIALYTPAAEVRRGVAGQRLRNELTQYLDLQAKEGVIVVPVDANGTLIRGEGEDPIPALNDEHFIVPPAPEKGPNFSELPLYQYTTSEGERLIYVSVPMSRLVRGQREGIYAIIVAVPETSRRDVFRDLFGRLVFSGAVGMGAATLAIALFWLSLYRPLAKVGRGVRAVAAGDYQQRVPVQGPTEVRALARDVNTMAGSVQASQSTLREFLANVSHELKTPLTSIRGFAQALNDGTLETPEERLRAARVIDAESRRVLQLVGELLDLSRIESGQQPMELADLAVGETLAHVRDVFSLRASEAGVTLAVDAESVRDRVRGDFDRIEQVLGNLIDNAFRHTPRGGRIEVGVRPAGAFVEFYVADNGKGIDAADLPHVFERFYRSQLGEPDMPGQGLGLAISREIVRAHGGAIRASARAGGGVEFAFTLPRTGDGASTMKEAARPASHGEGTPATQP